MALLNAALKRRSLTALGCISRWHEAVSFPFLTWHQQLKVYFFGVSRNPCSAPLIVPVPTIWPELLMPKA